MTQVQDTSKNTYFGEIKPTEKTREDLVYEALQKRPNFTIAELTAYLGWQVNSITGRLDTLEKKGLIEVIGGRHANPEKRICRATGRLAMQWRIRQEQLALF